MEVGTVAVREAFAVRGEEETVEAEEGGEEGEEEEETMTILVMGEW